MTRIYYKVLDTDGSPCHGGTGHWYLPPPDEPGKWMPTIEDPVPCERGYHLCRDMFDLLTWLGPAIYTAEPAGKIVDDSRFGDKVAVERARLLQRLPWDTRIARSLSIDYAARVLHIFEEAYPKDTSLREALQLARRLVDSSNDDDDDDGWATSQAPAAYAHMTEIVLGTELGSAAGSVALVMSNVFALHVREAATDAAYHALSAVWRHHTRSRGTSFSRGTDPGPLYLYRERRWQAARLAHYLGVQP